MNIPKKLRRIFKGYVNTFFIHLSVVHKYKVTNFAYYEQAVNSISYMPYYQ
jgi:hypothetical protein